MSGLIRYSEKWKNGPGSFHINPIYRLKNQGTDKKANISAQRLVLEKQSKPWTTGFDSSEIRRVIKQKLNRVFFFISPSYLPLQGKPVHPRIAFQGPCRIARAFED
jgi:hypothetical protein